MIETSGKVSEGINSGGATRNASSSINLVNGRKRLPPQAVKSLAHAKSVLQYFTQGTSFSARSIQQMPLVRRPATTVKTNSTFGTGSPHQFPLGGSHISTQIRNVQQQSIDGSASHMLPGRSNSRLTIENSSSLFAPVLLPPARNENTHSWVSKTAASFKTFGSEDAIVIDSSDDDDVMLIKDSEDKGF